MLHTMPGCALSSAASTAAGAGAAGEPGIERADAAVSALLVRRWLARWLCDAATGEGYECAERARENGVSGGAVWAQRVL